MTFQNLSVLQIRSDTETQKHQCNFYSVEACGDNLTASVEQKEYQIAQPEDGRSCSYNISTTPGHGIAFTIVGGGTRNSTGEPEGEAEAEAEGEYDNSSGSGHLQNTYIPELCNEVIVTITSSTFFCITRSFIFGHS